MIKTIVNNLGKYKKDSILTPAFMILEVLMEMIIPLLMASIVDKGIGTDDQPGDINHIYMMGGFMIVIALIGLFAGIMGGKYGSSASAGLAKNLRNAMYDKIQTFSFANIDKFSTSGLITRLTTDVTNVQNAWMMILRMGFRAPFSMIIALIMAFLISPRLSLVYLGAVIVLAFILFFIISRATKYFNQVFQKYDDLNASVQENVSAIRVVKAFVREDHENKKFTKATANLYNMFVKAERMVVLNGPIMQLTVYTCILLLSYLGAKAIVVGELTTGQLMNLLTYCMNILMSLMMLSMIFVMSTMSAASVKRIGEVLDEETKITNPENPVYEVKDGSIEFKNVKFSYHKTSERPVLSNINLSIKPGETIGIIGGTGSAKTSLVNLISRLYDVNEGSVLVGGRDVREYDLETIRNEVSVVLQKNVLFSGTIIDNLRWGDENATEEECIRACRLACADEFIQKLPEKYEARVEQGGANFSGGQKQRLCIARALLKKPKILILDDSTSAVDTATDAKIRKAFAQEIPNTTKIIIAQRVSSVEHADRIIVMDDGQISGFDTHKKLLETNEIYRDVYESQTGGSGDFDEKAGED